jgi:uncharacterized protein
MAVMDSFLGAGVARRRRLWRAVALRLLIWPPMIAVALFFGLRRFEFAATWHPERYDGGTSWRLPASGADVWFASADGTRLHGWFVRATTKEPARGTILYAHGNGGNLSHVGWLAEELAARGFDVLLFDYRGYGRSAGGVADEGALYADAEAAYDYLLRARGVAPARLVLYGQSLGTTAVVDLAARKSCGALVVESGLASASAMATKVLPFLPRFMHALGRNRFASVDKLPRVACPVLVAHGEPDHTIPTEQGRALYAAARGPKRLLVIPGAGHNIAGLCGDTYLDAVADFIHAALTNPQEVQNVAARATPCVH